MQKLTVDMAKAQIVVERDGETVTYAFASDEGFDALSQVWLRAAWDTKYVYSFTWMDRPVIQLPEDLIRIQELIYKVKPDVLVETGVAHGGSLVYYASLFKAMDKGRVIGIDIEIRQHNRKAIEEHPLFDRIQLVEGSSTSPVVINKVKSLIQPHEQAIVVLDACHTKEHVLAELEAYAPLVKPGSYIFVMDGIMERMVGAPRSQPDWNWNNPKHAARQFAENHPEFEVCDPPFQFNEGVVRHRITHALGGILKRIR